MTPEAAEKIPPNRFWRLTYIRRKFYWTIGLCLTPKTFREIPGALR